MFIGIANNIFTGRIGLSQSSFNPADIDGLAALYDISDLSSLFVESSGATTPASVDGVVGTVKDLSGNNFHLASPSDAARAILRLNNGLYSLQYDGTDDAHVIGTTSLLRNMPGATAVVAHNPSSGQSNPGIFCVSIGTDSGINRCLVSITGGKYRSQSRRIDNVSATSADSIGDYTALSPTVQTAFMDWAGNGIIEVRVNGVEEDEESFGFTPVNSSDTNSLRACMGSNLLNSNQYFAGHIYFVALYQRALNSTELAQIEAYAATKCGATL